MVAVDNLGWYAVVDLPHHLYRAPPSTPRSRDAPSVQSLSHLTQARGTLSPQRSDDRSKVRSLLSMPSADSEALSVP